MKPPEDITAQRLDASFGGVPAEAVPVAALNREEWQIALASSSGAGAVVLLHMPSRIDQGAPVLLADALLLSRETLASQRNHNRHLGLRDSKTSAQAGGAAKINGNEASILSAAGKTERRAE